MSSISELLQSLDGWVPCGTGIAPLGMVISVPVFQGMALGKIIKVNFYDLFQSLDLRGVRPCMSQRHFCHRPGAKIREAKVIYDMLTAWRDVRTARTRSRRARLSPPWACISPTPPLASPPQLPTGPPRPPPPGARQPRRTHRPFGRRTLSFLLGARRARSGCG